MSFKAREWTQLEEVVEDLKARHATQLLSNKLSFFQTCGFPNIRLKPEPKSS